MPSPQKYRLDEFSSSDFSGSESARHAATDLLADALTRNIRAMLQRGDLMIENGMVIPSRSRKSD
jgi:hypothetical protein